MSRNTVDRVVYWRGSVDDIVTDLTDILDPNEMWLLGKALTERAVKLERTNIARSQAPDNDDDEDDAAAMSEVPALRRH